MVQSALAGGGGLVDHRLGEPYVRTLAHSKRSIKVNFLSGQNLCSEKLAQKGLTGEMKGAREDRKNSEGENETSSDSLPWPHL